MLLLFAITLLSIFVRQSIADSRCVWATGKLVCNKNQSLVIDTTVSLFDRDGVGLFGQLDPDDKMAFTNVANIDGIFSVEGCASDTDIVPGVLSNIPEPYLRIHHRCNHDDGDELTLPSFKVFVPNTFDYYMNHPIVLDDAIH